MVQRRKGEGKGMGRKQKGRKGKGGEGGRDFSAPPSPYRWNNEDLLLRDTRIGVVQRRKGGRKGRERKQKGMKGKGGEGGREGEWRGSPCVTSPKISLE